MKTRSTVENENEVNCLEEESFIGSEMYNQYPWIQQVAERDGLYQKMWNWEVYRYSRVSLQRSERCFARV